ncbi:YidC/Oxa1 family membrane protein insertase [Granulicatella balaenopterae]|uniref:Membrane protein insertase YidC n=2 Tax=Granulicatella balaenopterae TaxID=137733 RepID=A0A1H9NB89_9LACT|nr:YidC/Oxa1 family membrane protein insertase [Granulicatella balaenopterae]
MKMKKHTKLAAMVAGLTLFLTACSTSPITEQSTGFWDKGIVYNFSQFIVWLSEVFGGSYGVGIIVFTIITRVLLLPLMHFQYKATRKTAILQPKVKELREKYSSRDRETQMLLQEKVSELYKEEGINQYAALIPLFIQLPIMIALYQAISRTEVLKTGTFLWFQLDQPDPYFILPVLAAFFTLVVSWLTTKMQDQGMASKIMMFVMPTMILVISIPLPSILGLYWVVGNVFSVIQTLVMNNPFKFRKELDAKLLAEKQRQKALEKAKNPKKKHTKRK